MPGIAHVGGLTDLSFRLLGPLQVTRSGVRLPLGGRQQKAVLALLLIHADTVLSIDRLADAVWGATIPPGAVTTIRTYIGHLRDVLEPERDRATPVLLVTEAAGYRLRVDSMAVDATRFEREARAGEQLLGQHRYAEASVALSTALAVWRGPVLGDLADFEFARVTAARYDELRLTATEGRIEADLALGRHRDLVGELDRLTDLHPLRERLHEQRMLARYRCGDQAGALAAYGQLRESLADELGIDPARRVQDLHQAILRQDPALDPLPVTGPHAVATTSDAQILAAAPAANARSQPRSARRRGYAIGAIAVAAVALAGACVGLVNQPESEPLRAFRANSVGQISGDGRLLATVPVGQSPSGLAYGHGSLWVANSGDDTIQRIDATSGSVVQTIPVGRAPSAVAVSGEDVWVANGGNGTVSRINMLTSTVVDIVRVGNLPAAIGTGPSGVWVANSGDDTIQRIDRIPSRAEPPIRVGGDPAGIAVGSDTVWVTNSSDGTVSPVRAATGSVQSPIHVGAGPRGIAVTNGAVWVGNSLEQSVSRIDRTTGSVVTIPVGDGPQSVVAGAGGVWVSGEFDGSVTKIDPASNRARGSVATGSSPRGLAVVGSSLWVAAGSLSERTHRGGTLTVSGPIAPSDTVDPAVSWDLATSHLLYDGLTALRRVGGTPGQTLVPDLATTLPTPTKDGLTYTFTVRRGVHYSNGVEVRPDDIRRGLQRTLILRRGNPAYYAAIVGATACANDPTRCDLSQGVEVDDAASTITFHLTQPDPEFLYKLTVFVWATAPGVPMRQVSTPVPTTAAYMIAEYRGPKQVIMRRNPYFDRWSTAARPDGYPDVIRWTDQPTAQSNADEVVAGRADFADLGWGVDSGTELAIHYPTRLHTNFAMASYAEWLNTSVAPFNDLRVRRALNYAVDRTELVRLWGGRTMATLSCQMLPPNFPGHQPYCPYTVNPDGEYHGPDLATARELVKASRTAGMTVRVWSQPFPPSQLVNQYFAQVLRTLGYHVPRLIVNGYMFSKGADSRNHVQIGDMWWGPDYPGPSSFWQPQLSCGSLVRSSENNPNLAQYCNPALDELGQRALEMDTRDPAAARQLWAQLDRTITDDAPMVFGPASLKTSFVSARVGNFMAHPLMGPLLDQMWVQ
jgi:YVTN family beta-propeller protein